jgi:hypothetical protein
LNQTPEELVDQTKLLSTIESEDELVPASLIPRQVYRAHGLKFSCFFPLNRQRNVARARASRPHAGLVAREPAGSRNLPGNMPASEIASWFSFV